jgi:hypothetical protein
MTILKCLEVYFKFTLIFLIDDLLSAIQDLGKTIKVERDYLPALYLVLWITAFKMIVNFIEYKYELTS